MRRVCWCFPAIRSTGFTGYPTEGVYSAPFSLTCRCASNPTSVSNVTEPKCNDTSVGCSLPQSARFAEAYIDIVEPLPRSNGFFYLPTCIDKFTRWPEAVPIRNTTAATAAQNFVSSWLSCFGVPGRITMDCGHQFKCCLFTELLWLYVTCHVCTTQLRTKC